MFTDKPATPSRVETLLDLMRTQPKGRCSDSQVAALLQSEHLPGVTEKSEQATEAIKSCEQLGLIERGKDSLRLTFPVDDRRNSRTVLCEALDVHVLGKLDIEPYFATFYSYVLGLGHKADMGRTSNDWVNEFCAAYPSARGSNRFNTTEQSFKLYNFFQFSTNAELKFDAVPLADRLRLPLSVSFMFLNQR